MKINIERKTLEKTLETGSQMAGRNKLLPILDCVKMIIKGNKIRVTSFSGSVGISISADLLSVDSEDEACVCLEPKRLLQNVKLMDGEVVSIYLDKDMKTMTVEHDSGKMEIPLLPAADFPEFGKDETVCETFLDSRVLTEWAGLSEKFAATDELRPALCGMYMYCDKGECGFCASDSHFLVTESFMNDGCPDFSAIIPSSALGLIQKCFKSPAGIDGSMTRMRLSKKSAVFTSTGVSLYTQLTEGRFPNFKSIIPAEGNVIGVKRQELMKAVKRASLCSDSSTHLIRMSGDERGMLFSAEDMKSSTRSAERCTCEGLMDIQIGLNGDKMAIAADSVPGEDVKMTVISKVKPVVLRGQGSRTVLVMPIMI